jgi:hypothetical protein
MLAIFIAYLLGDMTTRSSFFIVLIIGRLCFRPMSAVCFIVSIVSVAAAAGDRYPGLEAPSAGARGGHKYLFHGANTVSI